MRLLSVVMLLLPIILPAVPIHGRPAPASKGLELPVLQRHCLHGALYNSSIAAFYETRGLVGSIPDNCMDIVKSGKTHYSASVYQSAYEKVSALEVDGSVKLAILSGLIKVDGEAGYSWGGNAKDVDLEASITAQILTEEHIVDINCLDQSHFVTRVLKDTDADYMVTSKSYGFSYTVKIKARTSSSGNRMQVSGKLSSELKQMAGLVSIAVRGSGQYKDSALNSTSQFTYTIEGDVSLPGQRFETLDDLVSFKNATNLDLASKMSQEKGRVLFYGLTHMNDIFSAASIQRSISPGRIVQQVIPPEAAVAVSLAEKVYIDAVTILRQTRSHEQCIPANYSSYLEKKIQGHLYGFAQFQRNLSEAVVRQNLGNSSIDGAVLKYTSSRYSPRNFSEMLERNFSTYKKILWTMERLEMKNVSCLPLYLSMKDFPLIFDRQTVVLFEFRTSKIEEDLDRWTTILRNLTKTCKWSSDATDDVVCFHVDCDLTSHMCSNATKPTLRFIKNGNVRNVSADEDLGMYLPSKIMDNNFKVNCF